MLSNEAEIIIASLVALETIEHRKKYKVRIEVQYPMPINILATFVGHTYNTIRIEVTGAEYKRTAYYSGIDDLISCHR